MPAKRSGLFVISLLGALSVVSPFAIDMYLPAFPELATGFGVPSTTIALTLSSYFIGLALGQVVYGPLLDRFGRKPPLVVGLVLFIVTSVGCAFAPDVYTLIGLRFVQALGGCVAQVASVAMVRDFFPRKEAARVLSRLFLFIAVSPLLAPTVGTLVIEAGGWPAAFLALAVVVAGILALVVTLLPEGHKPDRDISLRPGPILSEYGSILRHPRFHTFAGAGAFSFAGLFTFVAGSPILFRDGFGVDGKTYSLIFALLAGGFIGASQLNVALLRYWPSEVLFRRFLTAQVVFGWLFLAGTVAGWLDLYGTLAVLFAFLCCVGVTNPNASALAIAPFSKNAGSASALLGFFQLGTGAVISMAIGAVEPNNQVPIVAIFGTTASIGLAILVVGRKRAEATPVIEHPEPVAPAAHDASAEENELAEARCCPSSAP
ncbi:Bicyclomycin resistance protein [Gemmata obscuriglobus]|uniref:Bcr/CflA family drug resistance efflux transporter n=1 Tax=Gemmata obscuriglobus TaxID=114 RepID=A0A2Z3HF76_9BACT|nr:multidrug effflux MFS transporter [Gemmata obscuriglobus]AWM42197.1 Bcr/CflA family drug resistance efflux transporter [Gemmata obscuriglobus]QEG29922.1 Bicyclomycin resistance protein [Gemmata obscuriglobus]VTS09241.1 multidrug transporter : Drug resistance transporter, Bcr/CflA subfamily OS=Granulicella mallensis (strain ATCC BAA-1857 / DSM 23137 / MP5ACTX8) GN=AciX8_2710 PE=4 SV=1: MFS_1 [Gemmata obscuriglobus UQM 2246]